MLKRKLSESDGNSRKKLKKLNSGSYGNVFSDGVIAYKISKYDLENDDGINSEILNEIIYLKKFRENKYLLSLKSVEITHNDIKILIPLAISDLSVFIREKTLIERGSHWDLLTSNIFSGLEYLQRNNICHLDIKPGNILFFGDHFKLNDFNLTITTNNLRKGISYHAMTVLYRPPEVIIHNDYYNILDNWMIEIKSDMWSLGCTLYEYITGNHLLDIRHNSQLLKLLYTRLSELDNQRQPYDNYLFLQNINNKIYNSLPLIGLMDYMLHAKINKCNSWYNTICSMVRIDSSTRPTAYEIMIEYGYSVEVCRANLPLDQWSNFNYYEYLSNRVGYNNKYGLMDKVKFMAKLSYDYSCEYDRKNVWNTLWNEYNKTCDAQDYIFLEIFNVMDRYLGLLKNNSYKTLAGYVELFNVVNRLINKLRRPEIADSIECLPKNKSNKIELDVIRVLEYDFALSPVKVDDMSVDNISIGDILN